MKKMKKFFAMTLALVMMLTLAVPTMAADSYDVTINGYKTGHTYEAYQIFSGTLDSTGKILANIEWGKNIDGAAFLDLLANDPTGIFAEGADPNIFEACTTAAQVAAALTAYSNNDVMLDTFAKYAGNYLLDTPAPATSVVADADGLTYLIEDLEPGYYLIKDTDGSLDNVEQDFYTKFILTVVGDSTVTVKGSVPGVEKTVNDTIDGTYHESDDAQIGDKVYFKLEGTLPSNFRIYEKYFYRFVDELPNSLTYGQIEKVYIERAGANGAINEIVIPDSNYVVTSTPNATTGGTTLEIDFANLKASTMPALLLEDKIVVKFSAVVNENANLGKVGNTNSVTLEFSNNPYSEGDGSVTPPDIAIVYTFGMDVDKFDAADNTITLAGAQFALYTRDYVNVTEGENTVEKVVHNYVLIENGKAAGWYSSDPMDKDAKEMDIWEATVAKAQAETPSIDLRTAATVTSDANGDILVEGLDAHAYRLLEVKAPDGYNLPYNAFVVIIQPVYDTEGNLTGLNYEVDTVGKVGNVENGMIEVDIENGKGDTLPSTGGMGTTLFYAIGGVMVLAAVVLLVTKKRMSVEK